MWWSDRSCYIWVARTSPPIGDGSPVPELEAEAGGLTFPRLLKAAWAYRCGRWVWGQGRASGPCISSSCRCAATGGLCRRSPAAEGIFSFIYLAELCPKLTKIPHQKSVSSFNWKARGAFKELSLWWGNTYMLSEKVGVWGKHWVDVSDILHDVLHCPQVGVLTTGPRAVLERAGTWEHQTQS